MVFKRILVVATHPDDETLGCGGTIARLISKGREVRVLILGGVTTSRYKKNEREEAGNKNGFGDEAEKAAGKLGVRSLTRCDFDDNRFDTVPLIKIIKSIEGVKEDFNPDLVITQNYSDLNIDHRITHQAVMTAFRPSGDTRGCRVMAFETLSSTEYQDQEVSPFIPNYYVDIKDTISQKIEAMKCYESELKNYPHPRSIKGIEILARKRGMEAGIEYAEAFRIIREVQ